MSEIYNKRYKKYDSKGKQGMPTERGAGRKREKLRERW